MYHLIFLQVVKKDLTLVEALRACGFTHEQLPISTLRYHVSKRGNELENADQGKENRKLCGVVFTVDNDSDPEDMSPLTDSSAASVLSISSSSNSSKRSRLNSRQASAAQLKRKEAKNRYEKQYKAAFKEATNQVAEETNTEPVKEMLARLNKKHKLTGDGEKKLTRSTIYRHTKAGRAGAS